MTIPPGGVTTPPRHTAYYAIAPVSVARNPRLSMTARALYVVLDGRSTTRGSVTCTQATLAYDLGRSVRTVARALDELRAEGLVGSRSLDGRALTYAVVNPARRPKPSAGTVRASAPTRLRDGRPRPPHRPRTPAPAGADHALAAMEAYVIAQGLDPTQGPPDPPRSEDPPPEVPARVTSAALAHGRGGGVLTDAEYAAAADRCRALITRKGDHPTARPQGRQWARPYRPPTSTADLDDLDPLTPAAPSTSTTTAVGPSGGPSGDHPPPGGTQPGAGTKCGIPRLGHPVA